ncbi:MAG: SRPBCC family protein [bacterium]
MPTRTQFRRTAAVALCVATPAVALRATSASPTSAASAVPAPTSVTRSVDIKGSPAVVWAVIGPYCAIADWHPAIASCKTDGKSPPTRTLVTKDKAMFVELETARSDANHLYSYTFIRTPLPVSHYTSTIKVTANGAGMSTVTWSGSYDVDPANIQAANDALVGIYESGLASIKDKLDR